MKKLFAKLTPVQWLAVTLIVFGMALIIPKARGLFEFSKEARYAAEHDFAAGNLSPDLMRPWMSIRYIAAAYAVPQQYLFDAANIQPRKESSMVSLSRLNQQLNLGQVNGKPALMETIQAAVLAYRANPVVTGLLERQVEDWMTMQYVANSTGLPLETLFEAVNLPVEGNANLPLDFLSRETHYPGGTRALVAALQALVEAQGFQPGQP